MTIADDIINQQMPDFDAYIKRGESLDDIDEYGFTPLIEAAITRQVPIAEALLHRGVDINKSDTTGRFPLHWAVDNDQVEMAHLLLENGADPNAYTRSGFSILIYPLLRRHEPLKRLLYSYGAKPDFAQDFIYAKLLGHRYELQGYVDILNTKDEFIELDFEGFILEFTVAVIRDSLHRFVSSYSARHLRASFPDLYDIMDAFALASDLLKLQYRVQLQEKDRHWLASVLKAPMLILPAASTGHAIGFIRVHQWWAKIDRGENSLQEGSVNIYRITRPEALTVQFLEDFLYENQGRQYYHQVINQQLGLMQFASMPIPAQITGNCSWANIQAIVPVALALLHLSSMENFHSEAAMQLYHEWMDWDQERALDESIQRFYLASPARKATYASMLASVLFQACDYNNPQHLIRAEKILKVLTEPAYRYVLNSYINTYCVKRLTKKGKNLLQLLDDCGVNPELP